MQRQKGHHNYFLLLFFVFVGTIVNIYISLRLQKPNARQPSIPTFPQQPETTKPRRLFTTNATKVLYVIDVRGISPWQLQTLQNDHRHSLVLSLFLVDNDHTPKEDEQHPNVMKISTNSSNQEFWRKLHLEIQQQQSTNIEWIVHMDFNTHCEFERVTSRLLSYSSSNKEALMLVPPPSNMQQQFPPLPSLPLDTLPCIVNRELAIRLAETSSNKTTNQQRLVVTHTAPFLSQTLHDCHNPSDHLLLRQCQNWNVTIINDNNSTFQGSSPPQGQTTFVTVFFPLSSKHSVTNYHLWMENMLSIQDPVIVFVPEDYVEHIQSLRRHALNQTMILPVTNLSRVLPLANQYSTAFWEEQLEMDPEKDKHQDYTLFWIWLSKSWFVMEAIRLNPFGSDIFLWCDIGSFRFNTDYVELRGKKIVQHPELVPRHAILQMATKPDYRIPKHIWFHGKGHRDYFFHSGSQTIGYGDTWKTWHNELQDTVQLFVRRHYFIGEDQYLMQHTCLRTLALCLYVHPDDVPNDDSYFGMKRILHEGGNHAYQLLPALAFTKEEYLKANFSYQIDMDRPLKNTTIRRRALRRGRKISVT